MARMTAEVEPELREAFQRFDAYLTDDWQPATGHSLMMMA